MAAPKFSRYYTYIKPVIQNPTVKSTAPHVFSLLAILVFTLFALRPTISTILNLQKDIDNNQIVLTALEDKGRNLSEGKNNLENLGEEVNQKIRSSIPDSPDVSGLVSSLQNSADKGASISALQIQPVTIYKSGADESTELAIGEVDFSFNIQGSYIQLVNTLEQLRGSPRLLQLTSVSISKQQEGFTVLSVTGKGFYLK